MDEQRIATHIAKNWFNYCREVYLNTVKRNSQPLGGLGKGFEINETKVCKMMYYRGKITDEQRGFRGSRKRIKAFFIVPAPERSPESLLSMTCDWIHPGTTIVSDC